MTLLHFADNVLIWRCKVATEMQTLIIWALLTKKDGAGFQSEIKPQVKRPDRNALVKAGLIRCEKRGARF